MKNTLKPLPELVEKENELAKLRKDKERLDWLEKSDYELYDPNTDALYVGSSREVIDEAMGESKLDALAEKIKSAGLDNADYI